MPTHPWPLESGPLVLRDAAEPDIERMLSIRNDPGSNRWTLVTRMEPEAFRAGWLRAPDGRDYGCVADLDGEVVGLGFLEILDGLGQPGLPKGTEAEIGYLVAPEHSGRGIATHLATGLLAACFGPLGLRRVTAGCYADHGASARVLEKAGMRREQHGVEDSWHDELGWIDGYTYGLLAHEWAARQQGAAAAG